MSLAATPDLSSALAVIGMAGRFPGARDLSQFWENLRSGIESISTFSDEELRASGIGPETYGQPGYVRARGALADFDLFDAGFFGISPREAEILDPQHRLFLECCWEALESSGYDPESAPGEIGVFGGTGFSTYLFNLHSRPDLVRAVGSYSILLANDKDFLTTRVAYKLNLRGPCVTVQTACSTSLVAVHLAGQSLLNGECDLALAGGVSLTLPERAGYPYEEEGILSPDGHCRPFDARAAGTVGGSGVGVVVLKKAAAALADGDPILALVRGTAINNDGAEKVSYTAPSVRAQARVIAEALAVAQVHPDQIGLVEAHGTGTRLGDPIEFAALCQAFRARTKRQEFCFLGSVKASIGHLDEAAGIAGMIKAILALGHGEIPPLLHFERPNPEIDLAASPFVLNPELRAWPRSAEPRRAGVSSLGIGGTNAYAVLEEAPPPLPASPARPWSLLALSARSPAALDAATAALGAHLARYPDLDLPDVAHTTQVGRRAWPFRRTLVARDLREAAEALLGGGRPDRLSTHPQPAGERSVYFLLSGQGAQYPGMSQELYRLEPAFRERVDHQCELLRRHLDVDLRRLFAPADGGALAGRLDETWLAQPALFVLEYALAGLWMEWGLKPAGLLGHSVGEYAAACLAGVVALEDALALVAVRGRLMHRLPEGAMLSLPLAAAELAALLPATIAVAAINGPRLSVVSGPTAEIERLERDLAGQEIPVRRLRTSRAFHSPAVAAIHAEFLTELRRVPLVAPRIPYLSNETGDWQSAAGATDPEAWARHLQAPVRFADGLARLLADPGAVLLEVGPGNTLTVLAGRHPERRPEHLLLASTRRADEETPDRAFLLQSLGRLWAAGVRVDWQRFLGGERRRRVALPTYPFERQRFWVERDASLPRSAAPAPAATTEPGLYLPCWVQAPPPAGGVPEALSTRVDRWLLFLDRQGVGDELAARLAALGQDVLTVRPGAGFLRLDSHAFSIAPGSWEDHEALLAAAGHCDRIVHLWNLAGEAGDGSLPELPFVSLLGLARALARRDQPTELSLVLSGAQAVSGEEELAPERAAPLALCRILPQEHPRIACRSIDVTPPADPARLAERLLRELCLGGREPGERSVAYRGPQRFLPTYGPVATVRSEGGGMRLRQEGVYLIVGGLGRVGLVIAEMLARRLRARLVLTGRTAPRCRRGASGRSGSRAERTGRSPGASAPSWPWSSWAARSRSRRSTSGTPARWRPSSPARASASAPSMGSSMPPVACRTASSSSSRSGRRT